ncbi:flagellar basal-body MS-ring/collar protein FliF [Undibacterium sp. Ji49W]|uniref:flagellar basal-body MS-ring/collar protein FliF n=1 Tax=Undibacterium sp. Ji49W TaxID=3413040 RepID=UPI003BF43BD0
MIKNFWNTLGNSARIGFIGGLLVILIVTVWCTVWLLRTDYQVLFADLKPQDSAAMVAELDRLKIPYKISESGNAILVDKEVVHTTRLKLMGKDIPLNGAVGFELFNTSDFGMTEFAQKINFQRALQGEITRTISALDEVKDVRVHLALPEESLFKRNNNRAKAAITINLKPGKKLRQEQITGIQKLVAAAVPGIQAQDVTLVDYQGVALTRSGANPGDIEAATGNLDLKKETENLLSHKANEVLEHSFGVGQSMASVDVVLNMDQVRVTTENVLSAPAIAGQPVTGVIIREKETIKDSAPQADALPSQNNAKGGSSQRDTEYQVGRKVEQVVGQPGSIQRLNVVAVVRKPLDEAEIEKVKTLVAAAVGVVPERGDTVVVQSLSAYAGPEKDVLNAKSVDLSTKLDTQANEDVQRHLEPDSSKIIATIFCMLVMAIIVLIGLIVLSKKKSSAITLNAKQREQALKQIQEWMGSADKLKPVDSRIEPVAGSTRS